MRISLIYIGFFVFTFFLVPDLYSQLSYGGKPMMNDEDFSAQKVLYLLPPQNKLFVEGLKSKAVLHTKKTLEYAIERPVDIDPEFNGEWTKKDGRHVWRVHIISPEAFSIGVLFSEYELAGDTKIFIYDPDGNEIKGAFTSQNNKDFGSLFVGHIPGEEVIIEMQVGNPDKFYGKLRIGSISHAFLPVFSKKHLAATGLGASQDCEIDINCPTGDDWQILKKSVVYIKTTSLLCTGTMVNNTAYNGKPYVLTAEHCINKDVTAGNSIYYFGYENSECGKIDGKRDRSVSGSHLMATGSNPDTAGLDFSLLKLTEPPPREFDVYYAGWDARVQEHSTPVTLHHPNGDAKKISIDFNSTTETRAVPGDLDDYIISSLYHIRQWDIGSTEGGSSGCPLFNTSRRVIGLLSGGLASCGDSIGFNYETNMVIYTLSQNEDDYYTRFSSAWDHYSEGNKQLKKWLDPISTGQRSIGGLNSLLLNTEDKQIAQISVYPNPTGSNLNVLLPDYLRGSVALEIINMTGKVVYSNNSVSVFPINIDVSAFIPGIYIVKVIAQDSIYTGSVIVQ